VGVLADLLQVVDRRVGQPLLLEDDLPFRRGLRGHDRVEDLVEGLAVLRPQGVGLEPLVLGQIGPADHLREADEKGVGPDGGDDVGAVLRLVALERGDGGVDPSEGPGDFTLQRVADDGVFERGVEAVDHGDVDVLAPSRLLPVPQGRQDADRGLHPRDDVAHGGAHPAGRAALGPGDAHEPAVGLGHHVIGGPLGVLGQRVVTEAADGAIDDSRIDLLQVLPVQAHLLHGRGPEVLHNHVGLLDHLDQDVLGLLVLEVQHDPFLVAVEADEVAAEVLVHLPGKRPELAGIVPVGRLDVDDLGPEVGEDHRRRGGGQHVTQVNDSDTFQRSWHICFPSWWFDLRCGSSTRRAGGSGSRPPSVFAPVYTISPLDFK